MKIFEITAQGFDGSTDETDDHVLWIAAESREQVEAAIKDTGATVTSELPLSSIGIDFVLTTSGFNIGLHERLNELASNDRNKNRA